MSLMLEVAGASGLAASLLGWIVRRRRPRRVSLYDEKPLGMSDATYANRRARRRVYRALAWLPVDALTGLALGALLAYLLLPR
jgi:hypothetical protein